MRSRLVSCQDMELQSSLCLETVTGKMFVKKEEFVLCIYIFGEGF